MVCFEFPWPPSELSPNARVHWAQLARVKKKYRETCYLLALTHGARTAITWGGSIHAVMEFYPPNRRKRDDDNLMAMFKSGRDGLADALEVNDNRFRVHPQLMDETGGKVVVKLMESPHE